MVTRLDSPLTLVITLDVMLVWLAEVLVLALSVLQHTSTSKADLLSDTTRRLLVILI